MQTLAAWVRAGRSHTALVSASVDGDGVEVDVGDWHGAARLLSSDGRVSVDGESVMVADADGLRLVGLGAAGSCQ